MSIFRQIFQRRPVSTVLDEQLYEARVKALETRAAAEHYMALADMYDRRVQRLEDTRINMSKEQ